MAGPMQKDPLSTPRGLGMAGLAILGAMVTGFAGLLTAIAKPDSAGTALIAAALAFGLLANAMFRR